MEIVCLFFLKYLIKNMSVFVHNRIVIIYWKESKLSCSLDVVFLSEMRPREQQQIFKRKIQGGFNILLCEGGNTSSKLILMSEEKICFFGYD